MNEQPIAHVSYFGTTFVADRADLRHGVRVNHPTWCSVPNLLRDYAEFGGWHAINIHPHLHSFGGYDTIRYDVEHDPPKFNVAEFGESTQR